MLLPLAVAQPPRSLPTAGALGSLLALALLGTALAQLVLFRVIQLFGARKLSLVTYLIPAFALAYGALILDESITPAALGGLALILIGVALALGSGALRADGVRSRLRHRRREHLAQACRSRGCRLSGCARHPRGGGAVSRRLATAVGDGAAGRDRALGDGAGGVRRLRDRGRRHPCGNDVVRTDEPALAHRRPQWSRPRPAVSGPGIAREATHLVQRHLLDDLGFHRLQLEVYAFNERALAHAERCGFTREGVRRKAYWREGEWTDGVLFGLVEEDLDEAGSS